MEAVNYYDQLTESFNFDNTPLLIASGISFAIGYSQYVYTMRLSRREGKTPMPFWMHSFYLAHDATFGFLLGRIAPVYNNHWYLKGTSTAYLLWTMLEIYCIYKAVFKHRVANFSRILGSQPPLSSAILYAFFLQLAMLVIVFMGIEVMGTGCTLQWGAFTNVIAIVGPTHEYLSRGSRDGLSIGYCIVNIACVIWTFSPFSMWALAIPELFAQPYYYTCGVAMFIYSVWLAFIVASYPPKTAKIGASAPIW